MKRILHISKYYEPFKGGTEEVARSCVRALKDRYEQRVICFNHRKGDAREEVDGVEVVRVGCFAKIASQSLSLGYYRRLKREIAGFQPDAIVFHYPNPFVAWLLLNAIPAKTKLAVYWHLDIVRQKLLGRLFRGQNRRLVERADMLIATSPPYVEGSEWLSGAREKVFIIPNCVDEGRLAMSPKAEALARQIRLEAGDKTLCLAVGRHTKYKGFDVLIEAARALEDDFLVCVAGAGEESEALKRQAAGVERIRFLGRIGEDELLGWMKAADIFCFPSVTRNEAFGLALAEAMYFRKPAVTFTLPGSGVNYVCRDGQEGLEVANGDASAYARAIRRLGADEGLRAKLGENGRKRVEENFLYVQFRRNIRGAMDALMNPPETGER